MFCLNVRVNLPFHVVSMWAYIYLFSCIFICRIYSPIQLYLSILYLYVRMYLPIPLYLCVHVFKYLCMLYLDVRMYLPFHV